MPHQNLYWSSIFATQLYIAFMMKYTLSFTFCALLGLALSAQKTDKKITLFNGKDLTGWQTYLSIPDTSVKVNLPKNAEGQYTEPLGFDNDPLNNYTVVTEDGQPAIRVTGEVFGHIRTIGEYENYHLTLQFKWGTKKYAPRKNAKRDAGLLYHSVGVPAKRAAWSQSQECQIQEGDVGDYFVIGGSTMETRVDTSSGPLFRYKPDGELMAFEFNAHIKRGRCVKMGNFEKPNGEWNTVEIYTIGNKSMHVVNGHLVMVLENGRMQVKGERVPLTKGKIQLQSEGAEIFYRNITIEPISELPKL